MSPTATSSISDAAAEIAGIPDPIGSSHGGDLGASCSFGAPTCRLVVRATLQGRTSAKPTLTASLRRAYSRRQDRERRAGIANLAFGSATTRTVSSAGDIPPAEVREATAELDKVRAEWLERPEVTGMDVGLRRGGEGLAIRVYVQRKPSPGASPSELGLPERLARFPVEVIEATFAPQQS